VSAALGNSREEWRRRLLSAPLLIVSPHQDDAWFSCAALLLRSERADVLNVFTEGPTPPRTTEWDLRCGFRDSAASTGARLLEDARAFAGTPHRVSSVGLLGRDYLDDSRDPADARAVAEAVALWAHGAGDGAVVALPAGAGSGLSKLVLRVLGRASRLFRGRVPRHPEHLYVRDAGLAVLDPTGVAPLLYEELPYLWSGGGAREARRAAALHGRRALELTLEVDRREKARRIACYASQLLPLERRLDDPEGLPPRERYWLLELPAARD